MCQKAIIPHNLRQPFLAEYLVKVHWLAIGKLVEKTSICGWDRKQLKLFFGHRCHCAHFKQAIEQIMSATCLPVVYLL